MNKLINKYKNNGFTLIELLMVIVLIIVLATFIGIKMADLISKARAARLIADVNGFSSGFRLYNYSNGDYPFHDERKCPAGMDNFITCHQFLNDSPLGGLWNYEGADLYGKVGVSIINPNTDARSMDIMIRMDEKLDDGDLTTGRMILGIWDDLYNDAWPPQRLYYTIEESWTTCGGQNPNC